MNQTFATHFFAGQDPIGHRFGSGKAPEADEIVGVVSDAKYRSLREPMTPIVYGIWQDQNDQSMQLEVSTRVQPGSIIEPVRKALAALDPALPFTEIETMSNEVQASAAGERLTATLASIFGALAAVLAAIGIYGLLAYVITQRHREIGIRMALGARPSDVGEMIGKQALAMVIAGVTLGIGASMIAAPLAKSLLYGVEPLDPWSPCSAALLAALIAAAATAIPVMHATSIDPASALRQEQ